MKGGKCVEMRKRISILINSLAGGGAERQVSLLTKYLNIDKVILLENDINYNIHSNIKVLTNHTGKTSSVLKTLYIPIYALKLKKFISNNIIISFLERSNFVNICSKLVKKHKVIICERIEPSQEFQGKKVFVKPLIRFLYKKADFILANSKGVKWNLIVHFGVQPQKIKVIYNVLDLGYIDKLSKQNIGKLKKIFLYPTIINIGRLTKQKGQWFLLRIFSHIKKELSQIKLVILGDGELRDFLIQFSKNLGLKTWSIWNNKKLNENYDVYFLGFQKNPFKYTIHSEIFVLSSLWEGFPNVLLEAMACGVPVISSDCYSGPREILAPDTDFIYKTKEPEFAKYGILMPIFDGKFYSAKAPLTREERQWVKVIVNILKDKNLREGYKKLAKKRATDFSIKNIIPKWYEIINML